MKEKPGEKGLSPGADEPETGTRQVRLVALDLDGVVWRGAELLPEAPEALAAVVKRGLDLRYVSNNSTAHRETVSARLAGWGLPAGVERVLTSGFVAAQWLKERLPEGALVMVVGEEGLVRELREAGFDARHARAWTDEQEVAGASPEVSAPQAVVVGMDRSFSYAILAAAQAAVRGGALFVATNPDATFPTPGGLKPGAGSLVAAVATAAEREPVFMGKPGLALAEVLAAVSGVPAKETLFVGDRLETDILMGRRAGMLTALVLTGVTSREALQQAAAAAAGQSSGEEGVSAGMGEEVVPHYVLSDLGELSALLDRLRT